MRCTILTRRGEVIASFCPSDNLLRHLKLKRVVTVSPQVTTLHSAFPNGSLMLLCHASGYHPASITVRLSQRPGDALIVCNATRSLPLPDGTFRICCVAMLSTASLSPTYECAVSHGTDSFSGLIEVTPRLVTHVASPTIPVAAVFAILIPILLCVVCGPKLLNRCSRDNLDPNLRPADLCDFGRGL